MQRLIDDLLEYATARDGELKLEAVSLNELVGDIVHSKLADANSPTNTGAPLPHFSITELPDVEADPIKVRRVFENVIGNAIKYTAPGESPQISVAAMVDHRGRVRVEIADRGIGIPEGERDEIFAPFRRAHASSNYAGTGLGLAICQRIVERHEGSIGVLENPGGGSKFYFTLPSPPV